MPIKFIFLLIMLKILQITAQIVNEDGNETLDKFDETSFFDFSPSLSKSSKYLAIVC